MSERLFERRKEHAGLKKVWYPIYNDCMVYHIPKMLTNYGYLRQFSGQGAYSFMYVTIGT